MRETERMQVSLNSNIVMMNSTEAEGNFASNATGLAPRLLSLPSDQQTESDTKSKTSLS